MLPQINDVEKGYYADGEDAYDMRLAFPRDESSSVKAMTPLKQVVAVKPPLKRKEDEAEGDSGDGGEDRREAKESSAEGGDGGVGGNTAGEREGEGEGDKSTSVSEVTNGIENLSVGASDA